MKIIKKISQKKSSIVVPFSCLCRALNVPVPLACFVSKTRIKPSPFN